MCPKVNGPLPEVGAMRTSQSRGTQCLALDSVVATNFYSRRQADTTVPHRHQPAEARRELAEGDRAGQPQELFGFVIRLSPALRACQKPIALRTANVYEKLKRRFEKWRLQGG